LAHSARTPARISENSSRSVLRFFISPLYAAGSA
jgi:hypothetical protein